MSTELATTTQTVSPERISSYLDAMGLASKLTPQEKTQFIEIAQAFGLNPFIREIYATKYGEGQYAQFSIIVGYEVYLKRAERSGQLAGWSATTAGSIDAGDLRGIVTIYRKDWAQPLIHEVYYSEYVQTTYDKETKSRRPNKMWSEKPMTMIKKVAIAQGFRMAFSVDLGGIPYTSDEMPTIQEQAAQVIEIQHQEAKAALPPRMTREELGLASQALIAWQTGVDGLSDDPQSWNMHRDVLRTLKGIDGDEKVSLFEKMKEQARLRAIHYNDTERTFYQAEVAFEVEGAA